MNANSFVKHQEIVLVGNPMLRKEAPVHLFRKGKNLHSIIQKKLVNQYFTEFDSYYTTF